MTGRRAGACRVSLDDPTVFSGHRAARERRRFTRPPRLLDESGRSPREILRPTFLRCLTFAVALSGLSDPASLLAQSEGESACTGHIFFDSGGRVFEVTPGSPANVLQRFDEPDRSVTKPHVSPDGRTVAWVRYAQDSELGPTIWLVDFDGKNRRPLIAGMPGDQPAWSPDGAAIAFSSNLGGNLDIYVAGADGGNLRRLTNHEAIDEYPAWSPGGERIAFGSLRRGDFEIFVMRSDGSDLQQITSHPAVDFRPSWSPDGRWIAFSSSRADEEAMETFNYDIYLMRPDGTDVRQVTHHDVLALRPTWSPAGDRLAYQVGGAEVDDSDWAIYDVEIESGRTERLTRNGIAAAHPDWNTFRSDCRG